MECSRYRVFIFTVGKRLVVLCCAWGNSAISRKWDTADHDSLCSSTCWNAHVLNPQSLALCLFDYPLTTIIRLELKTKRAVPQRLVDWFLSVPFYRAAPFDSDLWTAFLISDFRGILLLQSSCIHKHQSKWSFKLLISENFEREYTISCALWCGSTRARLHGNENGRCTVCDFHELCMFIDGDIHRKLLESFLLLCGWKILIISATAFKSLIISHHSSSCGHNFSCCVIRSRGVVLWWCVAAL